jgi:hypothetical protein
MISSKNEGSLSKAPFMFAPKIEATTDWLTLVWKDCCALSMRLLTVTPIPSTHRR